MNANGVVPVSPALLAAAAVPLACTALVGRRFDLGLENTLLVGIARSFVQLTVLGFILQPIFALGVDSPWLVFAYVLLMIVIATKESLARIKYTYRHRALLTFAAFFVSITVVGTFAFLVIIRPTPRFDPQYVIPICGMLMGNCINGVSLTVNALSTQLMEGGRREVELYLSFGATGWEGLGWLVRGAIAVGATPILNSMNVIGVVSIPGMMTGQILGGSSVTEAAHYQILIIWLIATCTFGAILANVVILYQVAFDAHQRLRTDRFVEVVRRKGGKRGRAFSIDVKDWCREVGDWCERARAWCRRRCGRQQDHTSAETQSLFDHTQLEYGGGNSIRIQTRRLPSDSPCVVPSFCVSKLQFSVPGCHTQALPHNFSATSLSSLPSSASGYGDTTPQRQQRVLCSNLNASFRRGEIGVVTGPSGSGKSTLLRVLSGLSSMDEGDVTLAEMSLAGCSGCDGDETRDDGDMVRWRTAVRYVTQYKVDIAGTPHDFILRIASFRARGDGEPGAPSDDDMLSQAQAYLARWGTDHLHASPGSPEVTPHPYLDKEWKNLSGGESQKALLAVAMASRPSVLLLDEATSGLDAEAEKRVEDSVVEYAQKYRAVVLWVTHSEDIAERLLQE